MAILVNFLLLLATCELCYTFNYDPEPNECSYDLWGSTGNYAVKSPITVLDKNKCHFEFKIQPGTEVCGSRQSIFTGEVVAACDTDVPPKVKISNDGHSVVIDRQGSCKEEGKSHVVYYCEI